MKRLHLIVAACLALVASPGAARLSGMVKVAGGTVRGTAARDPTVSVFWGLPYAAAPVGPLRFRPPQRAPSWHGTRSAEHPGPICPQVARPDIVGMQISEDCLNLNVWSGAANTAERRPVMVWFHGGGRGAGASSDPTFDGTALARKGVVVVTVNYRGGPLGLLATPELSRENPQGLSGNYALLDSQAALAWVKRNIAAFGGDPSNVTVFGESFGAGVVNFLSLSPASKGLFRRQITQSHSSYSHDPVLLDNATRSNATLADGEAAGLAYMKIANAHSLADLRAMPWQALYAAFAKSFATVPWAFTFGGYALPHNYTQSYAAGTQMHVDALTGENRDENGAAADTAFDAIAAGRGTVPANNVALLPLPQYLAFVRRRYGAMADEFLKLYPAATPREAFASANRAIRDNDQISPWMWASAFTSENPKPVYIYLFSKAPPGQDHDVRGAYHGADVRYVFDNPLPDWTDADRKVADRLSSYWVNFARTGNPNGPGLPFWAAYSHEVKQTMEIGERFGPIPFPDRMRLDFWQRFYASQPAR